MRVLYVEDNPDLLEELVFQIGRMGYEITGLNCGQALLDHLQTTWTPDVLLLDLGLPDFDGLELANTVRQNHPNVVLVMVTARGEMEQRIEGWRAGADIYLTKPVHFKELRAVLESVASKRAVSATLQTGNWVLDQRENRIFSPTGKNCTLTVTESTLLHTLAKAKGQPVERDVLVKALGEQFWNYDMRRLESAISRLRKKLKDLDEDQDLLRPVRGVGYLLAGQLMLRNSA